MAKLFWKATAEQSRKLAWYCQFLLSGRVVSTMPPTLSILQWSRPAAMNLDISLAGTVTITVTAWTDESNQQQLFYGPLSRTTRVSWYQKKHSPIHYPHHHPIFISFFHLLRSIASSPCKLRAWQFFAQPLSMSSLVYLLVWSPPPHMLYISSPNQCLLFATHDHTIATCFAVVPRLYHLFLYFLSTPYLKPYLLP